MVPGLSSAASRMASPRATTVRTPSSKDMTPVAVSAVYSPRLWPAAMAGRTPTRSTASSTTRLSTKVVSWALFVWRSSSASASSRRRAMSRPATSDASPTSSHESCSTQGAPMPGFCEP